MHFTQLLCCYLSMKRFIQYFDSYHGPEKKPKDKSRNSLHTTTSADRPVHIIQKNTKIWQNSVSIFPQITSSCWICWRLHTPYCKIRLISVSFNDNKNQQTLEANCDDHTHEEIQDTKKFTNCLAKQEDALLHPFFTESTTTTRTQKLNSGYIPIF